MPRLRHPWARTTTQNELEPSLALVASCARDFTLAWNLSAVGCVQPGMDFNDEFDLHTDTFDTDLSFGVNAPAEPDWDWGWDPMLLDWRQRRRVRDSRLD